MSMKLKQLLKLKTTEKNVCCLYTQNYMHTYQIKDKLEDNYFSTDKGTFRFKFQGYYGKSPLWFKVIGALPTKKSMLPFGEGN